ncbi:MAG: patatin-like phospholipase family protein [Bacteroidales bacterium]
MAINKYIILLFLSSFFIFSSSLKGEEGTLSENNNIGIVLSGGAARGFAHLGVLQALEDNGIIATHIAGASMGAVLGAVYAAGVSPLNIYNFARKQNYAKLYQPSLKKGSLFKPKLLEKLLYKMIPHNDFDSLQKKLYIVITNLNTAEFEIHNKGNLFDKVVASASIPFFFEPKIIDSFTYVDGGILNNLPIEPLKNHCKHIIGVSVNSTAMLPQSKLKGRQAVMRTMTMIAVNTEIENRAHCHHFIEVTDAGEFSLLSFNKIDKLYTIGYDAALRYIEDNPSILELSNHKK